MKWTVILAMMMTFGAIGCLAATGDVTTHMIVATIFRIFFSVLLGCGLFAAAFFQRQEWTRPVVTNAGRKERVPRRITASAFSDRC